ncbi:MAG: OmpA family protein [Flavobacteriales bacterium]
MKQKWMILTCICSAQMMCAQGNYKLQLPVGLNSTNDDIACGMYMDQLLFATNGRQDLVNDYKWNKRNIFHMEVATRGNTMAEWTAKEKLFQYQASNDEGPGSYSPNDSVLYFSSANNYGRTRSHNLKIFAVKKNDAGWGTPELLPFCDVQSDYAHPWFDASQNLLVFSSNRSGGLGQMDIWFCYKIETGWSEPVNCGMMVNGEGNEIFPTVYDGDIYYSSNSGEGLSGFDLKKALRAQQWKSSVLLPEPFNSTADDISVFFLNEQKAMLTSNRTGGTGGDDIYIIEKLPLEEHYYTATLMCQGNAKADVQVTVTNALKEIVIKGTTGADGSLPIEALQLNQAYKLQLAGIDPSLFTECILVIKDQQGRVIKELRFNAMGFAELELLQLNYADLNLMSLEDESMLTIDIQGQVYKEEPGDLKQREPIMILDDNGNVVAVSFTNESGRFQFTDVKPDLQYNFKLAAETKAQNVLITESGQEIVLPVLNAEVTFQRLNPEEAIGLVNEYNEMIYVSSKDIFVINRIYYEYNSAQLTAEARAQLDKLVMVMQNNKDLNLELRSHTDSRGNDEYNMKLSDKRANSAVQYMATQKIALERLLATGKGETQLLNECDDGIPCSEPEHTLNRRTEIKISKTGLKPD